MAINMFKGARGISKILSASLLLLTILGFSSDLPLIGNAFLKTKVLL